MSLVFVPHEVVQTVDLFVILQENLQKGVWRNLCFCLVQLQIKIFQKSIVFVVGFSLLALLENH